MGSILATLSKRLSAMGSGPASLPERLSLARRAGTTLRLPAGAVLQVSAGHLRLGPPLQWLGERCVAAAVELRPGEVLVVPRGGEWHLLAGDLGVELRLQPPS